MRDDNKKVIGDLVGVDGNAFALMGHFQKLARKQGFENKWINSVLDEAMSGDYDHLLQTLTQHMDDSEDGGYDD
ncbi:MAG: hypothetical protein PSN34_04005 [Urechidicola sp.]|nr:hypothetical protein [Urechidicola sp.]